MAIAPAAPASQNDLNVPFTNTDEGQPTILNINESPIADNNEGRLDENNNNNNNNNKHNNNKNNKRNNNKSKKKHPSQYRACCCGLCPCCNNLCCFKTPCRIRITFCFSLFLIFILLGGLIYYNYYESHLCYNGKGYESKYNNNKCYDMLTCDNGNGIHAAVNGTSNEICNILARPSKGHIQILNENSVEVELTLDGVYNVARVDVGNSAEAVDGTSEDTIEIFVTMWYWDYRIGDNGDWNSNVTVVDTDPGFGWSIFDRDYENGSLISSDRFKLKVDNEQFLLHVDLNKWLFWGEKA